MRLRSVSVVIAAVVLLVTGCAPEPEPTPTPTAVTDPTPSATPTADSAVAPEAAFDVTCADVESAIAAFVETPADSLSETLSTFSAPNWYAGPAQYMFPRAGGIACSAGDEARNWEVTVLSNAQAVADGAAERGGYWGETASCDSGRCTIELREEEILVSATLTDEGLGEADTPRIVDALRALASTAAQSVRPVAPSESAITGNDCTGLLAAEDAGAIVGQDLVIVDQNALGGWGIPAEVYFEVDGSVLCMFGGDGDPYTDDTAFVLTALPAGAWALEAKNAGDEVDVSGADSARSSRDEFGRPVLDLRVDSDWIRLTAYEQTASAVDLVPLAAKIVENLTAG